MYDYMSSLSLSFLKRGRNIITLHNHIFHTELLYYISLEMLSYYTEKGSGTNTLPKTLLFTLKL